MGEGGVHTEVHSGSVPCDGHPPAGPSAYLHNEEVEGRNLHHDNAHDSHHEVLLVGEGKRP